MATSGGGRGDNLCGAQRKQGKGPCGHPAGYGTDHPGFGACKYHGGCTPNHQRAAEKQRAEQAVETYGLPRNVAPDEALLEEVHRTAGHIAWLGELIRESNPLDLAQYTKDGDKPSVWMELYQTERVHLARVAKAALDAGVAERQIKLAEQQGELLAGAVGRILDALSLTPEQWARVPEVVPRELRAVSA